jgi:hypothetical protein
MVLVFQFPAHLIVKSLLQKFRPHDAMSKLEFSLAVKKMQLHPGDNPTELFSQLPDIENRFGIRNYSEQQVITAIMRLIPAELRCIRKSRLLTLCEMENCEERYQRSVHPSPSAPKSACWSCGKLGHMKQACPSRKKGGNGGKATTETLEERSVGVAERLATEKPFAGWTR